jgi:hypothetical protein
VIKREWNQMFGILLEEPTDEGITSGNESLSSILIQSLNIELVNVILKAIAYVDEKYTVDRRGKQTEKLYQLQHFDRLEDIPKDCYQRSAAYNLKGIQI